MRAVTRHGTLRDRTVIVLMLRPGLRVSETSGLRRRDATLGKCGDHLTVIGKGHNGRDIPLNSTATDVMIALARRRVRVSFRPLPCPLSTRALPLQRLAQIMGHDSLDTTARYPRASRRDFQAEGEKIAWR